MGEGAAAAAAPAAAAAVVDVVVFGGGGGGDGKRSDLSKENFYTSTAKYSKKAKNPHPK